MAVARSLLFSQILLAYAVVVGPAINTAHGQQSQSSQVVESVKNRAAAAFLSVLLRPEAALNALAWIDQNWEPGMEPIALEALRFTQDPLARLKLIELLQRKTGQTLEPDVQAWLFWWWNQPHVEHESYLPFKRIFYSFLDPKFEAYFKEPGERSIRLDEIVWGGVRQDGIPPLRQPAMLKAEAADYLDETNVVFGISINGDARAYPKRILAWHEMFIDTVGGQSVAGVYCTLCGTVILYYTEHGGVEHALGTSGFLYRSNKLMYDQATRSLWSTMRGTPVMGPLHGKGIRLGRGSVVTTTWGEWRRRHPRTQVLSLDTGQVRDYSEGAAYRAYFATDELMFRVPKVDKRLDNKAQVLALRTSDASEALAITSEFLRGRSLYQVVLAGTPLAIVTDQSGAHRVYQRGEVEFVSWDGTHVAVDEAGNEWRADETGLHFAGTTLPRFPAHNAFWFGWYAAFPETELIY
ncbi:MAG: DUF3179 domain-containing protein [Gammaproteobacteria bacterium]|nr:DUF3179 domain-containing protein [Gammaproteobacteria bacterium]